MNRRYRILPSGFLMRFEGNGRGVGVLTPVLLTEAPPAGVVVTPETGTLPLPPVFGGLGVPVVVVPSVPPVSTVPVPVVVPALPPRVRGGLDP